jgi:hypothetical protein
MSEFKRYLSVIQEMKISIDFDEIGEDETDDQDKIIQIIQMALEKSGYLSEVEETKTSWQKTDHITKLKIFKRKKENEQI